MMESMGYEGRPEKRARLTLLGEGDRGNGIHEVGTFFLSWAFWLFPHTAVIPLCYSCFKK